MSAWLILRYSLKTSQARNRQALWLVVTLFVCAAVGGCKRDGASRSATRDDHPANAGVPWLVDIADESNLKFVHSTGSTGQFYFPEIAGSGCAFLDYDNDGDLDIYVIQSHPLDSARAGNSDSARNRLFRNDLDLGQPRITFVDVTDESGLGDPGYGMGVATGDYDNDWDVDVYVTNVGDNALYQNNGDGTFRKVSTDAMPPCSGWSTSAAFVDVDKDGDLDLFVADYVNFDVRHNKICHSRSSRRDYCGPQSFNPVPDHLYRNNGDGTFTDITRPAGVDRHFGSGLGVVCSDFNGDSWPDIYVANDGNANQLWINKQDGTFENEALLAGAAYNAEGMPEAGMGVSAADFDLDGDEDIILAHLVGEHNTLLANDGAGSFDDHSNHMLLAAMSLPYTAFGVGWFDIDNDGQLDLFFANGAVKIAEEHAHLDYPYPFPNQLVRNLGPPSFQFEDITSIAGPDVTRLLVSRGAAFGDVDNDGDVDILVSNSNGPLQLLRNNVGQERSWLSLELVGTKTNRSAIGAKVTLERRDSPPVVRRVHADSSYCSANDPRVHFGLGEDQKPQSVTVDWPGGSVEKFDNLPANRRIRLVEGAGSPVVGEGLR